jgi:hypothetical protein
MAEQPFEKPNTDAHPLIAPTPTSQVDEALVETLRQSIRTLKWVIFAMGVVVVAVVAVATVLVVRSLTEKSRVDSYLSGSCPFYYPVAVAPVGDTTSALGVNLVEGARNAFVKQACPGQLPPPSAELVKLGREFRIPIRY